MFQKIKTRKKINELIDKAIEVIKSNENDSNADIRETLKEIEE